MSFEIGNRPHISAENIRQLLKTGGYRREIDGQSVVMPRHEALVFAIESAAEHDHLDLIKELIADGADVSATADPLIVACEMGHIHIVKYLLKCGSNINGRGRHSGETPLMAAASCGQANIVKYLLDNGADSTMQDTESDSKNALGWAQMGFAELNWPNSMPDDVRTGFNDVIVMLTEHQ